MKLKTKKRNHRHLTWAAILATVPLAVLLWTVATYLVDRTPAVFPQYRFVMLLKDDLVDFVNPAKQKSVLADSPFHAAVIHSNTCYEELLSHFTPTELHNHGGVVKAAVFLAITNVGRQSANTVRFVSSPELPDVHNLGTSETLLTCVRVDGVDGTSSDVKIESVELISAGGIRRRVSIPRIPPEADMAVLPGRPGFFLGAPPSKP